jgi:hypothetical protein
VQCWGSNPGLTSLDKCSPTKLHPATPQGFPTNVENLFLFFLFEAGSHYYPRLPSNSILPTQPPKCWNYRCAHHDGLGNLESIKIDGGPVEQYKPESPLYNKTKQPTQIHLNKNRLNEPIFGNRLLFPMFGNELFPNKQK